MFSLLTATADTYPYVTIVEQDGSKTSLTAVGLTLTFADGNLTAANAYTDESKTVQLSQLSSLHFSASDETVTGIESISAAQDKGQQVIFNLAGQQLPAGTQPAKGVYIIKRGQTTKKIQVK